MPATAPTSTPTKMATNMAASPTASEMRPPYRTRASTSWPRSSVPSGWAQDGPCSLATKSISLIGTVQISGPTAIAATISSSTAALSTARRWRRNRRHASCHGEKRWRLRGAAGAAAPGAPTGVATDAGAASAESDTGVEPGIEDVGDEVAEDDEARE